MPDQAPILPVTPRKSEASPSRFIAILESTTDLVLMADCDGHTLYVNKAGRQILGWSDDEATERIHIAKIFPGWAYAIVSEHGLPASVANGSWSGETAIQGRSGREIPVLQVLLAHTDSSGAVEFYSTICRDISDRKQKELEQIEWSNRYDAAIRASGQVLFDWNSASGQIDYAGPIEAVTGYEPEELTGGLSQLRGLIYPGDRARFDAAIQSAMDTRDPLRVEFGLLRKDGRRITVEANGHFFLDRLGRIGRMVGFISDITLEKILELSAQSNKERLEQSVAERTSELEQANAALLESARQQEAVARLGQRALLGIPLSDLMNEAVELVRSSLQVDCASLNQWHRDFQTLRPNAVCGWPEGPEFDETPPGILSQSGYTITVGHPVVAADYLTETRFSPSPACRATGIQCGVTVPIVADGMRFGVLGAFSMEKRGFGQDDVSFLLGVANILSAAIERRHVEQTAHLAQVEAETANRAKSDFLSRMSHELRTPLNAILGFTQLLQMEEHDERQAESIQYISQAGTNLLELINEVLDIARLDAGKVEFHREPVFLAEVLLEATNSVKSLAAKNAISILLVNTGEEEAIVSTDRERLRQIFINLLSNAVKYNRPGGSVTVAAARKDKTFWKVSVTDSGHGIAADNLSRLFVPFERLGQKEGGTAGGTGLGLALCQRLAKGLGGSIGAGSTVGIGSTFWVEIPAEPQESHPSRTTTPDDTISQKMPTETPTKTILYVEDDLANVHLIGRIIESRKNLKLVSAPEGRMAMPLALEHRPALILLDLNLPDATGEELIVQFKINPETRGIPVILVTGEVASDRAARVVELGAVDVLAKPYRVQTFLALLDSHLR
jgi:PAS domain S-box-containing protein